MRTLLSLGWPLVAAGCIAITPASTSAPPSAEAIGPTGEGDGEHAGLVDTDAVRARGRALFTHNWSVDDPWSAAGDGLGPRFNATSCVACHAEGGVGGAGASHRDVSTDPHFVLDPGEQDASAASPSGGASLGLGLGSGLGGGIGSIGNLGTNADAISSIFGAPAAGPRNTPALFGIGAIDAIPDDAIVARAAFRDRRFPKITGAVSRTPEGRIGRFGWKGDVPTLDEFVGRACALELGLEIPGVHQRGHAARGVDLELDDVVALTSMVRALPTPETAASSPAAEAGARIFDDIGCTACHAKRMGEVDGLYSDLLLHDLGPGLADGAGAWGQTATGAMARMWRTPPLWGVRDSGPWMHDGRANNLERAVMLHGGEAQSVAHRFRALPEEQRLAVINFLETLVAPGST